MSTSFIGAVMMFGGNFAIRNFGFCNGTLLAIQTNQTLYSLLGTMYGGDGRSSFALPDMRGRFATHRNNGGGFGGLPWGNQGMLGGVENVFLSSTQIPLHTHAWQASANAATTPSPSGQVLAGTGQDYYSTNFTDSAAPMAMYDGQVRDAGSTQSHTNMMPYLAVSFIICMQGIYPSRN